MTSISVIIPTFERPQLLLQAIQSVLDQSFTDFEILVIDDGSTDNTAEIVTSITDHRVKYFRQPNKGVSAARNTGIRLAESEFISFLDHDDLYLPEKLSLQVSQLRGNHEIGLVHSVYYGTVGTEEPRRLAGVCHSPVQLRDLLLGNLIHLSTALVRRSWLEYVSGFDEQLVYGGEDRDIILRLALAGCVIGCVPKPLAVIRQQPSSLARLSYRRREVTSRTILDKVFCDPRMPDELQGLRNRAYATQLVHLAAWAYAGLQPKAGRDFLERALGMDPSLSNENLDFLVSKLVSQVIGLSLESPEITLRQMTAHLPRGSVFKSRFESRLWGRFFVVSAFQAHQLGQRVQCRAFALRAITRTPSCLRNRGFVSIFVRSLIGNRNFETFRRLTKRTATSVKDE